MKQPPMIVSGTTDTIPARIADIKVFSHSAVSGGTTYRFKNPGGWFTVAAFVVDPGAREVCETANSQDHRPLCTGRIRSFVSPAQSSYSTSHDPATHFVRSLG